ncbi:MAG: DUF1926 domain-containing protein [Candidatus Hydrogenedentes bacterium]|nr:DUF1926 domain-containing protein [Candidatus Hydrogenedentota bacterium]
MDRINLIFGCHAHQPVGNFEHVFADAYRKAYLPFIDVLERYPAVRVVLHYTGPLWDWFLAHEPQFVRRLAGLAERGQVEIMGGGYYEPLLCAVPERDAVRQIIRMNAFCKEHFGAPPRGMWLAERVWEPHMPRILAAAGIEYTVLDDMHFKCTGLRPEELFGYYITEEAGTTLKVFPILEKLRYLIPFRQVEQTLAFLREHATPDGLCCAVIHDDAEKFGVWPQTYQSVYEEGWLEEFFRALTENQDWLRCTTYADYVDSLPPLGRTYIPTASYQEMMAWALPTPMQHQLHALRERFQDDPGHLLFLRGGFWRNFLAKYPEANAMHKRMLRVSERIAGLREKKNKQQQFIDEAERLLHQGQCNCAYWHGVFGGLYLNHLRTAVYERLIAADRLLDQCEHGDGAWVNCAVSDWDGDTWEDVILENSQIALFLNPRDGGTLTELDFKPRPFNFLNTLARREEAYHEALRSGQTTLSSDAQSRGSIHELVRVKELGLHKLLVFDPYRRSSLRDHFLQPSVTTEELWAARQEELGGFATGAYAFSPGRQGVTLWREGTVNGAAVKVSKTIKLQKDASGFEIQYDMEIGGNVPLDALFGVEFVINLLTGGAPDRYYVSEDRDLGRPALGQPGCDEGLCQIALQDEWQKLRFSLRFSAPTRVHRFAIETVSQSEDGQERVYQGSVVLPCWVLPKKPGARMRITMEVGLEQEQRCVS